MILWFEVQNAIISFSGSGPLEVLREAREDRETLLWAGDGGMSGAFLQARCTGRIWGVKNDDPDSASWKLARDLDPVIALRSIKVRSVHTDRKALPQGLPREILDAPPVAQVILVASDDVREVRLEAFGKC